MNLLDLPVEILNEIASHLSMEAVGAFARTAKLPRAICMASDLWHRLVKRDFSAFLEPMGDVPSESSITCMAIQSLIRDGEWRNLYRQLVYIPSLTGVWIGDYRPHGFELIDVRHVGWSLIGTKLTGDVEIPAGKVTFDMRAFPVETLGSIPDMEAIGKIQLADPGYQNPRWCDICIESDIYAAMYGTWTASNGDCIPWNYHFAEYLTVEKVKRAIAANGPPDIFGNVDSDAVLQTLGWTTKRVAKLFPEYEADSESYQEAMREFAEWEDNYDSDDSEYQGLDGSGDDYDYDGKEDAADELPL